MTIQSFDDMRVGSFDMSQEGPSQTTGGGLEIARYVEFQPPFPEGSEVAVTPMVQTFNGPETPGLRIANVTHLGFKIRMNELVVHTDTGTGAISDGSHVVEKISWLAFRVQ